MSRGTEAAAFSASGQSGAQRDVDVELGLDSSGLPVLSDHMSGLRSLMDAEYERLRDQWQRLRLERDALNKIKEKIQSVSFGENERLRLNVSGTRFEIRTTCLQKNTFFHTLLSGTFVNADLDGFYYIDRDPRYVMVIFNALRDGDVELDEYDERQLKGIRADAEFFMVGDLTNKVDHLLAARRKGNPGFSCQLNRDVPTSMGFNGCFIEFTVTKRKLALHTISFVAGESRLINAEAFFMEGSMEASNVRPQRIGDVEVQAQKGDVITISFSTIALTGTTYTIGVYSASCPTAVMVCPTNMAQRDFMGRGINIEQSYHTANARGHINKIAGKNEFDLVGELGLSSTA